MKEFILWGNPPAHDDTFGKALLCSGIKTREAAQRARDMLEREHGVTDIHIQVLDGSLPAFGRASLRA